MHLLKILAFGFVAFSSGVFADSYDLPLFIINTSGVSIPDEPKIEGTLRVLDFGTNSLDDSLQVEAMRIGIETRGQTSAAFKKKSYGFELRDANGEEMSASLLGLPEGDDWVLHGPYVDKTLIRNAFAYYLYTVADRYSPRTRFAEMFLNGEYQGVYLLVEKIKRGKNRINIKKLGEADTTGDALTGGYIFRVDKLNAGNSDLSKEGFKSSDGLQMIYHYPKINNMTESQKSYLQNTFNNFEKTVDAASGSESSPAYLSVLDVDAAVDYILHQEITKNSDAYICSFYMSKNRDSEGGKIVLGPPWDFNLAFGAVSYNSNMDSTGWQIEQNFSGTYIIAPWLKKLFKDSYFQAKFKSRWAELRSSVWHSKNVDKFIDSVSLLLTQASQRNFSKWNVLGTAIGMDGEPGCSTTGWFSLCFNGYSEATWDLEVTHMRNYYKARVRWMDSQLGFTEPAEPLATERISSRYFNSDVSGFRYVDGGLVVGSLSAGNVAVYDIRGKRIQSMRINPGETFVPLPNCFRYAPVLVTLNGKRIISFRE